MVWVSCIRGDECVRASVRFFLFTPARESDLWMVDGCEYMNSSGLMGKLDVEGKVK